MPRTTPRLAVGQTRDIYINPGVTMFLRHDTDGELSLVVQPVKGKAFVMPAGGLETLVYWLGHGPTE